MVTCANCGQENPEIARFCLACGESLTGVAVLGEERRVVSVLFVDLVGFTAQADQLDPEDVRAILTPYHERVRTEMERLGGTVEKFVGDAVMGVFGAPTAYGDDAERAVRAAIAVRDWAETEGDLEVRIAVNTGEAIVALDARPGEAMIAGDVVNTASRLQSAAPVGCVLVGEDTYSSTRNVIDYRPAPPVIAKGKPTPLRVWLALRALSSAGERPQSRVPMVGRERELGVLVDTWGRVVGERRTQFVTAFGPSGIGKSRLSLEFAQHVSSAGSRVLRGRSTPYGSSSPYSAFAQHVMQVAGLFENDQVEEAQAKLRAAVAELGDSPDSDEHAEQLAILLGLGGDTEAPDRETLFFSARVLVESLARRAPLLLIFEDIHWADASLLDLLETLAARIRDVPVLLLALARPDLLTERPGWGGGLPAYSALPLDRLSDDAGRELAQRLLERAADVDRSVRALTVAETAEGNPLFIEELAASLAEHATEDDAQLPTSVRAIVAARLDALPRAHRTVLLDASVVGRVFWRGALTKIAPRVDLSEILGSLEERDLVRREAVSRIKGDQQFVFKHGLIRDVAYQVLPRAARRERHALVAEFLEQTTGGVRESQEALAQHWREAGDGDRAVDYLVAAGDQAGRGWAKQRAATLYREALELLSPDDARRRGVMRKLAVTLQAVYHLPDAQQLRGS